MKSTNLQRTVDAIERRDREVPELWERLKPFGGGRREINQLLAEIDAIEESVGIAFGEDTKGLNNPETCRQCIRAGEPGVALGETDVSFVRRMVRKWKAQT